MRMRKLYIGASAAVVVACATCAQAQSPYGIGRPATPAEIAGWNIDIDRYGNNLPPGSGSKASVQVAPASAETASNGRKTRHFDAIMGELEGFFTACRAGAESSPAIRAVLDALSDSARRQAPLVRAA